MRIVVLAAAVLLSSAGTAGGFYRVSKGTDGAWQLTDPSGRPMTWLGVDHVKFNGFRCEAEQNRMRYREENIRKFVTRPAWASNTVARLRSWGFNALGAGCDVKDLKGFGLGRTVFLALGDSATGEKDDGEHYLAENLHVPGTAFPNVFNPDFAERCDRAAAKACAANRDDSEILGYFIDNELAWEGRNRGATRAWGLFDAACAKPAGHSARVAVERFLAERGLKVGDEIPLDVKFAFVGLVAEKYFSTAAAAIRRYDPNHLVLGCRFAGAIVPNSVWQAAGRYCDVVTLNGYAHADLARNEVGLGFQGRRLPIGEALTRISALAGRPVLITEWSFPAFDSGLPCSRGAGQRFDTQLERARASALYAHHVLALPCVIGYDYFMWVDMPAKGISFGYPEDTNYGLVREDGTAYDELTRALAEVQRTPRATLRKWTAPDAGSVASATAEDFLAVYDPVTNAADASISFSCSKETYRVTNAAGLCLEGAVGGARPLAKVTLGGKDCGSLSAMVQTRESFNSRRRSGYDVTSHAVTRVLRTDWRQMDGRGELTLVCEVGKVAELTLKVRVGSSANYHVEIAKLVNTGDKPFAVDEVLILPYAPFKDISPVQKGPSPSFMNRPFCRRAWYDKATGRTLGILVESLFVAGVDLWVDGNGNQHPDVRFTPNVSCRRKDLSLAPGEAWVPEAPVQALVCPGEGGLEAWDRRSKRVPSVSVRVGPAKKGCRIKPVNGVGQPPFRGRDYRLIPKLKEAHVPYSRLHDVGLNYGGGRYVDIPKVFPDFNADVDNPASYDFAFTDDLLKTVVTNGVALYFRLGVSIENYAHELKPYYIYPPKDNLKWARICEGVVRHYTEGWANGFKWKIDHWEVWNEPDGEAPPERNCMWQGTFGQYLDLYGTTVRHLKAKFPHLKIGGYGSCGFERICSDWKPERANHHMRCFHDFLSYVKANDCAPDFFSFHCYGPWWKIEKQANYARQELDKAGLKGVPIHLTEWLCAHGCGTARQAALLTDTLVRLQGSVIDLAHVYDARCGAGLYSPLFDPSTWGPRKAYYGFRAFGELYARGQELETAFAGAGVSALGAADASGAAAVVVVNASDRAVPLDVDFGGRRVRAVRVTDETRDWRAVDHPRVLTPWSIWTFELD